MDKKGALELSMTTIIVIVIGVTLLILGLAFVRTLFQKATELTEQSFDIAEQQIQGQMKASEKLYISALTVDTDPGKGKVVYVGVQNIGEETKASTFVLEIVPGDEEGKASWFKIPVKQVELNPGDKKGVPIEITVPKGTPPGKTYGFTVRVTKDGQLYDSQPILVRAKAE